jgi:hypothetical protein
VIPDFTGKMIEIVKLDWSLQLWTDDNWQITLAATIVVTSAGPAGPVRVEVDPTVEPGPVPDELGFLEGATITRMLVAEAGDLEISVAGHEVVVRADPDFEAWEIRGHRGEMLICAPGGELVHFPAMRSPEDGGPDPSLSS